MTAERVYGNSKYASKADYVITDEQAREAADILSRYMQERLTAWVEDINASLQRAFEIVPKTSEARAPDEDGCFHSGRAAVIEEIKANEVHLYAIRYEATDTFGKWHIFWQLTNSPGGNVLFWCGRRDFKSLYADKVMDSLDVLNEGTFRGSTSICVKCWERWSQYWTSKDRLVRDA